eukprot:1005713-Rhodomonas_salina.1
MMIRMHAKGDMFTEEYKITLKGGTTCVVNIGIDGFFSFKKFFFIGMKPSNMEKEEIKREI